MNYRRTLVSFTDRRRRVNGRRVSRACAGQAMVELAFMIVLLVSLVLGIFEFTVMYYNQSVVTNAVHQAAWAAANGAHDLDINNIMYGKMQETLVTAYIVHDFSRMSTRVFNRFCEGYPDVAPYASDVNYFTPRKANTAGYAFRAEGYHIQLAVTYKVGFSFPFLGFIETMTTPIVEETRINARNDLDHDGLVDGFEQEYYDGIWSRGLATDTALVSDSRATAWRPYAHADGWRDDMTPSDSGNIYSLDADQDGWMDAVDTMVTSGPSRIWSMTAKYDRNNDGLEDKYDIEWRNHPSRLHQ